MLWLPFSFLIAALGMAIGIGGSSIISRALRRSNSEKATKVTFGIKIINTSCTHMFMVILGLYYVIAYSCLWKVKEDIFGTG